MASLSADQVRAVNAAVWGQVGPAWINQLSADAFQAIPIDTFGHLAAPALRGLSADAVGRMSAEQLAALTNIGWIPESAVSSIRADQMRLVKDFDTVSARWLNALSPEAFAAIPTEGFNQMSLAALQGLDGAHRAIAQGRLDKIHAGYLAMASSDASINYDSVLSMLGRMVSSVGADGLSTDQVGTINAMLAGARAVNGGTTYVSSLLSSMFDEGLTVGTSAQTFSGLVDKWFLGTNNPTLRDGAAYIDVGDKALFGGTTDMTATTVGQGSIGDCGLIASFVEFATVASDRLNGLIGANGNGTYAVKFYRQGVDTPFFVTVDSKVANYGVSSGAGAWARLLEEAYVEALASTKEWGIRDNDLSVLGGTGNNTATRRMTGGAPKRFETAASAYDSIVQALRDDDGYVTFTSMTKNSTDANGKAQLVGSHVFAVTGINETNGNLIIRNPWTSSLTFEMSAAQIDAVPGACHFYVTQLPGDYGSGAVPTEPSVTQQDEEAVSRAAPALAPAPTIAPAAPQADLSSLVQAMATFDVTPPAATSLPSGDAMKPQTPNLATSH